ncbi:MAG TPA: PAS domain S-box protein, partial [Myxococcaceae bacterium]|nr:PAS domain S-box protein [Myxococcaceae bacterium]
QVLLETTEAVDSVVLFLKEGEVLRVRAAVGAEAELASERFALRLGEGLAGRVVAERQPLEIRAAASDPRVVGALTRAKGIRALYGVPLMEGDEVIGVASIGSLTSYDFSSEDKLLFGTLVHRLSALIVQARLREREHEARARAEESLALVNALWANASAGFALVDPQLRYVRVNEALAALDGIPVEAHPGRRLADVLPPEIGERAIQNVRQVLETGEPVLGSVAMFRGEGSPHLQADHFPVRTRDGRLIGVGLVVVDITRHKQTEEMLRAQRNLLESLLQAQSDLGQGFAIYQGVKVAYVNEAFARISGYSVQEMMALDHFLDTVVPEERSLLEERLRDQAQGVSEAAHFETAIRHKVGYRVELEIAAKRLPDGRLIALARDITERKQAQQDREQLLNAVQAERRSMEAVLESLPVGVLLAEAPSGRIIRGNAQVEAILGHPVYYSAGVEHYHEWRGLHPDGRPYRNEEWPLARALRSGEVVRGEEMESVRPDGHRRTLSMNAAPIQDADGAVVAAVLTLDDITERKHAETQLTRALAFRDQLIGILGHDLRNPLGAIKMSAALMRQVPDLPERIVKAIGRIEHSTSRIGQMIADLLDFTHSRFKGPLPIEPSYTDLHDICRAAVDELSVIHPDRQVLLELEGNGRGCWDPGRMAQLVSNLVSNALQYGDPASPVRVRVSEVGRTELLLEVQNQGTPIPAEQLPQLFEPFRRGSKESSRAHSSGLGLGLYIVREIARAHGGDVQVSSSAEEGTRFSVQLPREPGCAGE